MRRLLLRLIKPFTAYQQMVNSEALDIIRAVAESTAGAHRALHADRVREIQRTAAELLELRRQAARVEELTGELDRAPAGHVEPAATEADGRTADGGNGRAAKGAKETLAELGG
jgi:hypothetical protein